MSGQKLWEKILQGSSQSKRHKEGTLILVGRKGCGSRHLISALQKGPGSLGRHSMYTTLIAPDDPIPVTCPLQYSYINVKDPADSHSHKLSKVNIYTLEQPELKNLLEFALNSKNLESTMFGIVLDWEQPWRFQEDLEMWTDVWNEMCGKVLSSLPVEEQDQLIKKVSEYVRQYKDPENESADKSESVIPEGVLEVNLGVPMMIIVCKSDLVFSVDKNRDLNEKILNSALKVIREFAISHGASIIYTSGKSNSNNNLSVLYEYIVHRLYNFRFKHKAQIITKDSVFIPSGWDSPDLIKETSYTTEKSLQDLLPKAKNKTAVKEEVKVANDQEFLNQMKEKLSNASRPTYSVGISAIKIGGDVVVAASENVQESAPKESQVKLQDFYRMLLEKGNKEQK